MAKSSKKTASSKKKAAPKKKATAKVSSSAGKKGTAKAGKATASKPPAKKAAAAKAPPKKAAVKKPSAASRVTLAERLSVLLVDFEASEAERFHSVALLLDQVVGAAFINLYHTDVDGRLALLAAHEKTLTYFREASEPASPGAVALEKTVAPDQAAVIKGPDLPALMGVDESGPVALTDVEANSGIAIPFRNASDLLGVLFLAAQEPQPHLSEENLKEAAQCATLLAPIVNQRAATLRAIEHKREHSEARTQIRKLEKEKAQLLSEQDEQRNALEARRKEELQAAQQAAQLELERLTRSKDEELTEATRRLEESKRLAIDELQQRAQSQASEAQQSIERLSAELAEFKLHADQALAAEKQRLHDEAAQAAQKLRDELELRQQQAAKELRDKHESEMLALMETHEKASEESGQTVADLRSSLEGLKQELEKTRQELAQDRSQAGAHERRLSEELQALRASSAQKEEQLQASARNAAEQLRNSKEKEIQELKGSYETQIQKLRTLHTEQLKREKAEIEELYADEIRSLQERLQRDAKEREREFESLRQRLKQTSTDLADKEATLEKTQQSLAEAIKESRQLEQNLAGKGSELSQIQARYQEQIQQLRDQKSQLEETSGRQNEQARAEIEGLKSELAETRKHLEDYRSTYEETKANFQKQLGLSEQRLAELRQTLEKERQQADRDRAQLSSRVEELANSLQQRESDLLGEKHRLAEQLAARDRDLERAVARLPALEESLKAAGQKQTELLEKNELARSELEALQNERGELLQKVRRLEQALEKEQQLLREETGRFEETQNKERAESSAVQNELKNKLTLSENAAVALSKELEQAKAESERLRQTILGLRRQTEQDQNELAEKARAIQNLNRELEQSQERATKLSAELDEARAVEQDLRSQIGIHRDREARLEQSIASMREEEHALNNRLAALGERSKELEKSVDAHLDQIAALKGDLHEEQTRARKLEEDLKQAIAREKGSRETGNMIAHVTNAISNITGLAPKLEFLRKNSMPDRVFERVLLFSLLDDDSLRFEDGFQEDLNLAEYRGLRIPIRNTIFGGAVASGHALCTQVGPKDTANPDIVGPLRDGIPLEEDAACRTLIMVPLREAEQVLGLLTFASSDATAPDKHRVELLEQIAPLIAVALKFEQNRGDLVEQQRRSSFGGEVNRYLERRFVHSVHSLRKLATDLGPVTESLREALNQELLTDIQSYADTLLPANDRGAPDRFSEWLGDLCKRAEQRGGIQTSIEIDDASLTTLRQKLGEGFYNLYWIAEEAITNAVEHSHAKQLWIRVFEQEQALHLTITDNGDGLMRTAGTLEPKTGTGLPAIRSLLGNCGGSLTLGRDSQGYGLALLMSWPLSYRHELSQS